LSPAFQNWADDLIHIVGEATFIRNWEIYRTDQQNMAHDFD
jgi:hypothetical protein